MKYLTYIALLGLTGCASLQYSGVASYTVRPFKVGTETICCEVEVRNGKEIAQLDANIVKNGDNYNVTLHETGVAAFRGQEIAANAATMTASTAGKVAGAAILLPVLPAVAPVAGAALAAPGLPAAALGAGAAIGVEKLATPPAKP